MKKRVVAERNLKKVKKTKRGTRLVGSGTRWIDNKQYALCRSCHVWHEVASLDDGSGE